jgi:hypothetical protein
MQLLTYHEIKYELYQRAPDSSRDHAKNKLWLLRLGNEELALFSNS